MCGRLYNTLSPEFVAKLFQSKSEVKGKEKVRPGYNQGPTKFMSVASQGLEV